MPLPCPRAEVETFLCTPSKTFPVLLFSRPCEAALGQECWPSGPLLAMRTCSQMPQFWPVLRLDMGHPSRNPLLTCSWLSGAFRWPWPGRGGASGVQLAVLPGGTKDAKGPGCGVVRPAPQAFYAREDWGGLSPAWGPDQVETPFPQPSLLLAPLGSSYLGRVPFLAQLQFRLAHFSHAHPEGRARKPVP